MSEATPQHVASATSVEPAAARVIGLGTATPACRLDQGEAARLAAERSGGSAEQTRSLAALYRMTRVKRRGSAIVNGEASAEQDLRAFFPPVTSRNGDANGPGTAARMNAYARLAPPIATRAAAAALDDAGVAADRITHLVTVSCTGFQSPGVDIELVRRLGLPATVQRVQVGFMGCHGALNGLATARALAASQPGACVLLCCVELCSLHFQYGWDEQQLVANALFADGAAAAVISPPSTFAARADDGRGARGGGEGTAYDILDTASCLLPQSEDQMTWRIGDHGFVMTLSPQVPQTLIAHVQPWLRGWLERLGQSVEAVDAWAVHPGGPRILDAVQKSLGLGGEALAASRQVLREHGNMSSPTILFILNLLRQERQAAHASDGATCVLLSFGPGLTGEAALLRRVGEVR